MVAFASSMLLLCLNGHAGSARPARTRAIPIKTIAAPLLRTVHVGTHPVLAAVDEATNRVFVVTGGYLPTSRHPAAPSSVAVLNATTGVLLRAVRVGAFPTAIAIDAPARRVFVLSGGRISAKPGIPVVPSSINVLDAVTGLPVQSIVLGNRAAEAQALAVDAATDRLFVAARNGFVTVLDATRGAVLRTIDVRGDLSGIVTDAHTARVFVANGGAFAPLNNLRYYRGSMSLLNAASGSVLATIHLTAAVSLIGIDDRAGHAIVVESSEGRTGAPAVIEILDATSGAVLHSLNLSDVSSIGGGYIPSLAVDAQTGRAFDVEVADSYGLSNAWIAMVIEIIDTRTGKAIYTAYPHYIPSGNMGASIDSGATVAVDIRRNHALVAEWYTYYADATTNYVSYGVGRLLVLDARTGRILRAFAVGHGPQRLVVDQRSGRIFILNETTGTVSVLDAARL